MVHIWMPERTMAVLRLTARSGFGYCPVQQDSAAIIVKARDLFSRSAAYLSTFITSRLPSRSRQTSSRAGLAVKTS